MIDSGSKRRNVHESISYLVKKRIEWIEQNHLEVYRIGK